jgi:transcriptional repressor NrdR
VVIKRHTNEREPYDRQKIINGLLRACEKRNVNIEQIEEIVSDVEQEIYNKMDKEVPAERIGEMVLERLRNLDEVAYVRFASVYRKFRDVTEFNQELQRLQKKKTI